MIVPKYRPREDEQKEAKLYIPCQFCFGTYKKEDLWKHQKRCPFKSPSVSNKNAVQSGKLLLPIVGEKKEFYEKVLIKMRDDDVKSILQTDDLILSFGYRLFEKVGCNDHQFQYVSQRLRELCRLLIVMKDQYGIRSLVEVIKPKNWEQLIQGIKVVAGYGNNTVNVPSLSLKIGHSLTKCAQILRAQALIEGNDEKLRETDRFLQLYKDEWEYRVSSHALSALHGAKFNKPMYVPLAEDVIVLNKYLKQKACSCCTLLHAKKDLATNYSNLIEILLAQIILFNRRRSGEAQRIKIEDLENGLQNNSLDEEIKKSLSSFEQELCSTHKRIEIKGKRGRKVPVFLTDEMQKHHSTVLQIRDELGIKSPLIFIKPQSSCPVRGSDCLRKFSKACGAKCPETLTSTKLRKHLATMTQILGLSETNLDVLAKFMGHDIRIHRQFYRLPANTVELAKVTKIMHLINTGNMSKYKGKDFDDIEFSQTDEVHEDELDAEEEEDFCEMPATSGQYTSEHEHFDGNEQGDEEHDYDMENIKRKKNTVERHVWTAEEKRALEKQFSSFIRRNKTPGQIDCLNAQQKEPSLKKFHWSKIKFAVKNMISSKKRKQVS
uniref:Uncharacterized protein n=1 Tax=Magallana gigas TaxID=29159 RepID=K1PTK9_MAGGI